MLDPPVNSGVLVAAGDLRPGLPGFRPRAEVSRSPTTALELVRCRSQLEAGARFCSCSIVSSQPASNQSRHVVAFRAKLVCAAGGAQSSIRFAGPPDRSPMSIPARLPFVETRYSELIGALGLPADSVQRLPCSEELVN